MFALGPTAPPLPYGVDVFYEWCLKERRHDSGIVLRCVGDLGVGLMRSHAQAREIREKNPSKGRRLIPRFTKSCDTLPIREMKRHIARKIASIRHHNTLANKLARESDDTRQGIYMLGRSRSTTEMFFA